MLPTTNLGLKQVYDAVSNQSTGGTLQAPYALSTLITGDTTDGIYVNRFSYYKPLNYQKSGVGGSLSPENAMGSVLTGVKLSQTNRYNHQYITVGEENYLNVHAPEDIDYNKLQKLINFYNLVPETTPDYKLYFFILESKFTSDNLYNLYNGVDFTFDMITCRLYNNNTISCYWQNTSTSLYNKEFRKYLFGFSVDKLQNNGKNISVYDIAGKASTNNWKDYYYWYRPGSYYEARWEGSGIQALTIFTSFSNSFRLGDYRSYNKDASSFGRLATVTHRSGTRYGYNATLPTETSTVSNGDCPFSNLALEVLNGSDTACTPYYVDKSNGIFISTGSTFYLSQSNLASNRSINFDVNASTMMQSHSGNFVFECNNTKIALPNFILQYCVYEGGNFIGEKYSTNSWFQPYPYVDAKSSSGNTSYLDTEGSNQPYVNISNKSNTFQITFKHQLPATLNLPSWVTASQNYLPDLTTGTTTGETTISFTATTNSSYRSNPITLQNLEYALYTSTVNINQSYIVRNITVETNYIYKVSARQYAISFTIYNNTAYADTIPYKISFNEYTSTGGTRTLELTGTTSVAANSSQLVNTNIQCDSYGTSIYAASFDTSYFGGDVTYISGTYMNSSGVLILP